MSRELFVILITVVIVACDRDDNSTEEVEKETGDSTIEEDGGSGTDSDSHSDFNTDSLIVTNLIVEPNPNSVISAFVSWKTTQRATGEVHFGSEEYEYKVRSEGEGTEHRVLVIGMHADTIYKIKAVSENKQGEQAQKEDVFKTGTLPENVPVATMSVNDAELSQPGWTLMNVQMGNGTNTAQSSHPVSIVMYDHDGIPVWYYINGTTPDRGGAISANLLDNNNILIGPSMTNEEPKEIDLAGNIVWEGPESGDFMTEGGLSHHVGKLTNGHYLILRDVTSEDGIKGALFEELDSENNVVWHWDLFDFLTPPDDFKGEWCHGNSATINIDKDEVYISCRWLGLIKTTYHEPTLLWHMPATYNASDMGDVTFDPPESQFSDIHDPEIHDDGTILFFDNGGWSGLIGGDNGEYHSRILEFDVDQETKEATLTWEFPGNFNVDPWFIDDFYCPYWGDADRLENGNILIAAGVKGPDNTSHVFEVTKDDGQVVWDLTLPNDHGVYRAERLSSPPLLEPID